MKLSASLGKNDVAVATARVDYIYMHTSVPVTELSLVTVRSAPDGKYLRHIPVAKVRMHGTKNG